MESQLSEIVMVLLIWIMREFIGYLKQGKKTNKLIKENTKHIKENRELIARIKNRM